MEENSKTEQPGKKPPGEDQKRAESEAADEVAKGVREAAQAETDGQYALASLLALHVLQLDSSRAEALAIFERCQAALGRVPPSDLGEKSSAVPGAVLPPRPTPPERGEKRPIENLFRDDALRHPIDLDGVPPLTPGPKPRGLGSRVFRAVLPFVILGLLVAGIWLASSRTTGPAPVAAQPAVAEPQAAPDDPDPVSDPRPGALAPGTVALNIVPWAKVDAIYSVYDGHEIEPDGLVSPCTVSLPPGRYSFTVSHPDFGSVDLPVIVKSGEVTRVEHSLISNKDLEKELAPALQSAGSPSTRTSEPAMQQSAALRR